MADLRVLSRARAALLAAGLAAVGAASRLPAAELPPEACSTDALLGASGFEAEPVRGSFDLVVQVPNIGARTLRLHVPQALAPPRRLPLLIALHGAGGPGTAPAAASFMRDAWSAAAETGGFLVLAPIASGAQGGWVPAQDYAILAQAIAELQQAYPLDPARIYLHGFSAGGHVAHDLGLYNADYFAAYAVNAGVLEALAGSGAPPHAAGTRRVPLQVRIGQSDPLLPYTDDDRAQFLTAGWSEPGEYQRVVFAGGHTFDAGHTQPAWEFLCRRAR